ncbi:hypothetical protein ACIQF6_17235 [Kitasatospora sp. NPDC092948]|uniref:hypothetical protein n=1 Tax=Kitasatospora sp. NPDC092948 TaxID=3364088 RepID=UPI0037F2EBC2
MRRFLTSLALTGATALLPVAGLLAAAPAAHASAQDCVSKAEQAGVPASLAQQACSLAADGNIDECTELLGNELPPSVAQALCFAAAGLVAKPDQQEDGPDPDED